MYLPFALNDILLVVLSILQDLLDEDVPSLPEEGMCFL